MATHKFPKENLKIAECEKKIDVLEKEIEEIEKPFIDMGLRLREARQELKKQKRRLANLRSKKE